MCTYQGSALNRLRRRKFIALLLTALSRIDISPRRSFANKVTIIARGICVNHRFRRACELHHMILGSLHPRQALAA